jgi:hypothetical protein
MARETPAYSAAQREFKARQRFHYNRIDVLLVKSWVCNERLVIGPLSVFPKWIPILSILELRILHRLIEDAAGSIVVDDLHAISSRTRGYFFGRYFDFRS